MDAVNPATGAVIESYEEADDAEVEAALAASQSAFEEWRDVPLREREELIANAADVLRENAERYARLMTDEMGKPVEQARGEVEKCAWACEYYAEHASQHLADEPRASPAGTEVYTSYEPLGPVLAVMPWNYPFWQVFRFAAPYLTAGNTGILKHASNVPGCALAIEEVFEKAGFPEGVFQSLLVSSSKVDGIIADDRVRAATLTGSEPAGRAVAETAGRELKKTVLELGGSDPVVVLDDADVAQAAETGAWARCQNTGQSCIAGKRFVVHDAVYDDFLDAFLDEIDAYTVGDPRDDQTDIGPMARRDLLEDLHEQVVRSAQAGADVVRGGEPLDREGEYYPPTVLTDVPRDAPVAAEETFGPVAAVLRVDSEEEAVEVANDTDLGLGASVWTEDRARGQRVAHRIDAGCTYVNELVKSDPRVPFGGVKDSGYGRELASDGIREFVNRKTIWVN
ncbi:NAD-dependent succinate-semialdehyde dehydrogenase [Halocalculus aciditolerans]|uniref:Succinate-semialdehyde dehydrogenase n=1 Tax=Halocalculus aciditolerans TaxID=1383812 RepID=A0A830FC42_9EURY|nr:NAD-dependent succinate-semialdehyde dehydrogenase [Halocalculus aciditolerans]GGL60080.1 succinate-semialdehyde dehydrogenase [Halocalculus aciditolerans]